MPTVLVVAKLPNEEDLKFELNKNEIIFDGLERQGLSLPHGCLAGSCGSCRIEIIEGVENLSPMSAVEADSVLSIQQSTDSINKNIRLSCRAKVLGDVTITILKK